MRAARVSTMTRAPKSFPSFIRKVLAFIAALPE
jgi:hypothetical protein